MSQGNLLYSQFVESYDVISRDRDFSKECSFFIETAGLIPSKGRILELFAGPAYHSSEFKNRGFGVCCVDNSIPMKELAVSKYGISESEYVLGSLPDTLPTLKDFAPFSLILALRYSMGLINWTFMEETLRESMLYLNVGGLMVLELHRFDLLMGNLEDLAIRERESGKEEEDVRCLWPSGPIEWDLFELKAKMPITLEKRKENGELSRINTTSNEWIYLHRDFELLARKYKTFEVDPISYLDQPLFHQSKLLVLRRI